MDLKLVAAIREYCSENGYFTTEQLLLPKSSAITNFELSDIFDKYLQPKVSPGELSFTFTLTNKRKELRKRISTMNEPVSAVKPKKRKKLNEEDKIPKDFLSLLDELGLNRKDAKMLYENKEQWNYVKSDRKIYCTVKGKISLL